MFYFPGGQSYSHDLEWHPLDLEEWEVREDEDEVHVQLREDLYWTQGGEVIDDFTAEDVVTMYEMLRYMTPEADRSDNPAETGWRAEDDSTFVIELNPDGYNIDTVLTTLRGQYVTTYRNGWFAERLEGLKDASTEDEEAELIEEVASYGDYTLENDIPLSGPYMLDEVHENVARFTINEDHWVAKEGPATPRELEIHILGGGSGGIYQAVDSGTVDVIEGSIPSSVPEGSIPDNVTQISQPSDIGTTLIINYGGPDIDPYMGVDESAPPEERVAGAQQAKIRQGIAHAVNFEHVQMNKLGARNAESTDPYEKAHPASSVEIETEFPDLYEQLPSYREQDTEMAEQRFEEAGLELDGGTWVKPNGEPLEIILQSTEESVDMLRTINEDLQEIGLDSELETLGEQAWTLYLEDPSTLSMGEGWINENPVNIELRDHMVPNNGWPLTVRPGNYEVPPIGDMDADPSETLDVIEMTSEFHLESVDDHRDTLEQLLWAYAYHLPEIPMFSTVQSVTLNTETMGWPEPRPEGRVTNPTEDDHPVYGTGFYILSHPDSSVHVPGDE
ncbi:ABC transporter substrate-binding protein [Halobacteria archaeon AArc-m2/3/4]|uniref:ABC transporter substrate-binding protein n=1 Tax=Natronoglomus mannanivorans TaxID=2979990 RepID=A0ABT2QKJ5_9EURY|nr:ABC transporter substrate-binding protein [Halobacteria archaeon AArc-m2/3/4]